MLLKPKLGVVSGLRIPDTQNLEVVGGGFSNRNRLQNNAAACLPGNRFCLFLSLKEGEEILSIGVIVIVGIANG